MYKRKRSSSYGSRPPPALRTYTPMRSRFRASYRRRLPWGYRNQQMIPRNQLRGTPGQLTVRQFAYTTTLTQAAGANAFGAGNFTLGQIPQQATFTALFDTYRVDYLEFTFRSRGTDNTVVAAGLNIAPLIFTVIDKDDSTVPGAITELQEYQNCEQHASSEPQFTRIFRPGVQTGAYVTGGTVAAAMLKISPWLDCAQNTVIHYGMKWGCTAGGAAQTALNIWDIDLFVGLTFKVIR